MRRLLPLLAPLLLVTACSTSPAPKPQVRVNAQQGFMASSAQVQTGHASWYGGKFHGRPTASGERFDKNALTAAHKKLPFQTRVRVTNTENGKSVVVRINDRMPDTPSNRGRIIDLSEAAFQKIAPTDRGLVPVKVEAE